MRQQEQPIASVGLGGQAESIMSRSQLGSGRIEAEARENQQSLELWSR